MRTLARIFAVMVVAMMLLASCSTRKNTAASRNYQAFITRYNVYFNGDEHFRTTLEAMEKKYEDEYSQRVYMHPAEARANPKAPQPQGSFTRSIEKAQKAIQLHSIKKKPKKRSGKGQDAAYKEWMKRDEYNPFLHNAWMMMGRSQYYNGDFAGAASTFTYISKHFTWLPATVTESRLWEALSYCGMDWLFEAETILKRIKPDTDLTTKELRGLYYFTYADYYVRSNDYKQAIPMLVEAIKYTKGAQKIRLNFLLGQLYAAEGMKAEAYKAFKAAGGASGASYRTQFNARIKQSEVYEGTNIEPEVKALRRMARYDRNKQYLDQIYYAIGNLYLSRADTTQAIEAYKEAVEKSTRNGYDKALVQIALGQLYFDRGEYVLAQPCYAEGVPQLPTTFTNYALLKRRSDVLDELATYAGNVELQDSLLRLAAMTPEQQLAVVNKIIEELKKKEKEEADEARRAEMEAQNPGAQQRPGGAGARDPNSFTMNNSDSWYFYNDATRNAGKTEFQRRWGSRRLEDNWRRRNKNSFNVGDFDNAGADSDVADNTDGSEGTSDAPLDEAAAARAADPHYPEYYLRQIPKTPEEMATSNDIIQEGLYNEGLILKDKLEDFSAAENVWDRLLKRYPDNIYRLDVYYNMYLMLARQHKMTQAERWRNMILADFPESKEGMALADPNFLDNLKGMDAAQEQLYEQTLDDYMANRNDRVHSAYTYMNETYPMSKIMPKFMFLHALAYVTEHKPDEFKNTLKELLERYPTTDITPLASAYLKGMAQGRDLHSGSGNMRGMVWDTRLSSDTTSTATSDKPLELEGNPEAPQLLVLLYPTDSIHANSLLYDIARHNFSTYVVRDFDLEPMQFGHLGLLVIKGFNNLGEVNHYRSLLQSDARVDLPKCVRPVVISVKDFDTLLKEGRSFDEYFRAIGEELPDEEQPEHPAEQPAQHPAQQPSEQPTQQPSTTPTSPKAPKSPTQQPQQPAQQPKQPAQQPTQPTQQLPEYPTVREHDPDLDD